MLEKIVMIKKVLAEAGIDTFNIAYVPLVPILDTFPREFIVEEVMGVMVLKLVSAPND